MTLLRRNWWWLLAIIPFALLLFTVVEFGVPVPYLDEWDLVPLLQKMYGGTLTLGDIWQLHNEHRLFFPQLIMLGLARLTAWDIRYEMATSIVLAAGIFFCLVRQAGITEKKLNAPELRWAIPLFSLIAFSISQYQNWLWGWQLEIFLSVLGAVGGTVLLANPPVTWTRFGGAAILGVIGSYSFGNGGVIWLVGLFLLLVVTDPGPGRFLRIGLWLAFAGLTMGFYFYRYERLEEHPPLTLLFSEPIPYLAYVLKFLGNICAQYPSADYSFIGGFALLYGIGGMAILIWAIIFLRRNKLIPLNLLAPYLALSLYSIGSAFVIGIGRLGLGTDQAVASRYCTVSAPFWASLVCVLLILWSRTKGKKMSRFAGKRKMAKALLQIVTLLVGLGSILALSSAAAMARSQEIGRNRLLTIPVTPTRGVDYSPLGALHPRPEIILERFPFLKEHRLSIFREESLSESR